MAFRPRTGTDDLINFQNVVMGNEYQLPASFAAGTVAIDIGAHVGAFALTAYKRGVQEIYCYEPEPSNFKQLEGNLTGLPGIFTYELAVWRSDIQTNCVHYTPSEQAWRTGGGNVLLETGKLVRCIAFDDVINYVIQRHKRVDLVKIDCEGAEWPILLTANNLDLIDNIYGEYHEIGGPRMASLKPDQVHPRKIPKYAQVGDYKEYTAELLWAYLSSAGFSVRYEPAQRPWKGNFWATRS